MKSSFLTALLFRYYPITSDKVQALIKSNVLLEKLLIKVYKAVDNSVQKYADIAERLKVTTRMVDAWRNKHYKNISYSTIFISVLILLYFVSPIDLLPDFIPVIGGLDDAILLTYLLKLIDKEIERFMAWEKEHDLHKAKPKP